MVRYEIKGGNPLNGTVTISGAKNAAVAILPAAILVEGKCRVENVPDISDVRILLDILRDLGALVTQPEESVVEIDKDIICHTLQGKPIKPKTIGQKKYVKEQNQVRSGIWTLWRMKSSVTAEKHLQRSSA